MERFTEAGFTHIAFCQLGAGLIRCAETDLLPALRRDSTETPRMTARYGSPPENISKR